MSTSTVFQLEITQNFIYDLSNNTSSSQSKASTHKNQGHIIILMHKMRCILDFIFIATELGPSFQAMLCMT